MVGVVVPDGVEGDQRSSRPPFGLVIGLAVIAVGTLLLISGGNRPIASTATTVPTLEPVLASSWHRLDLPGMAPLRDVAKYGFSGYVAAGDGPQFWWSEDGVTWELGESPDAPYAVSGVADLGERVVAVGATTDPSGVTHPAIVFSEDRTEWTAVDLEIEANAALEGVTVGTRRAIAWGWTGTPDDFAPGVGPLVVTTVDGVEWTPLEFPRGVRVHAVRHLNGDWHVMGSLTGQAVLFRSTDTIEWEQIDTDALPFGWVMADLRPTNRGVVANLVNESHPGARQWILMPDGWQPDGDVFVGPTTVQATLVEAVGVGGGRLWTADGNRLSEWTNAGLAGVVTDVYGNVAVGGFRDQPAVWVRGEGTDPVAAVAPSTQEAGWEVVANLGPGEAHGPWLVNGRWVVGNGTDWWTVDGEGVEAIAALAGVEITRIDPVGDEWVALPAMLWTSDGSVWEQRAEVWPEASAGQGYVAAATETEAGALVVGLDQHRLWAVAETTDAGHTWELAAEPVPTTPVRLIRPVPGGLTGLAAIPRNRQEVVYSPDGLTWEPLIEGRMIEIAEPPAVVTSDGRLVFLDTDLEFALTTGGVTAVARGPDGEVALVAGGRLWRDAPAWSSLPLGPAHGLSAADLRPLPIDGEVLVLAVDRGEVSVLRWP